MTVSIQRMSAVSLVLAVSLFGHGVQAADKSAKTAQPVAQPAAEPASSAALIEGKGLAITGFDIRADAQRIPPEVRNSILVRPTNVQRMASDLFVFRSMAQMAQEQGLDRDPKVKAAMQVARDRALAEAWMATLDEKNRPDAASAEKQARSLYLAKPERFKVDESVHVRHILIGGKDADARATADKLLEELKGGADFAALAKERSSDKGSGARGGDLGFFERGRMVPEFEKAAFALKQPGELSGVVESQFGFHVIQLVALRPAGTKPFEEVQDELVKEIQASAMQSARAAAAEKIRKDAKTNDAAVEAFVSGNASKP